MGGIDSSSLIDLTEKLGNPLNDFCSAGAWLTRTMNALVPPARTGHVMLGSVALGELA